MSCSMGLTERQWMTRTAALCLVWCVLALLTSVGGCVSHDEVARVRSPSGRFDAVLVETNAGPTTSPGYGVYVVVAGQRPSAWKRVAVLEGATRNEDAYGASLVWRGPTLLLIQFLEARSTRIETPMSEIDGTQVAIALREGVRDPSAPAGGMLYNLRRNMPLK